MPIIKSAQKRVRTSDKAAVRNAKAKRSMREAVKDLSDTIARGGKAKDITKAHQNAVSAVDTAAKKNIIHKNKAARKKSQLSKIAKDAGVKPVAVAKKPAVKKIAAKKPVTKKPIAKKAPAKKPAAKKTAK